MHLIATDPPFNKSRDFHATPDSLARGARFQDRRLPQGAAGTIRRRTGNGAACWTTSG